MFPHPLLPLIRVSHDLEPRLLEQRRRPGSGKGRRKRLTVLGQFRGIALGNAHSPGLELAKGMREHHRGHALAMMALANEETGQRPDLARVIASEAGRPIAFEVVRPPIEGALANWLVTTESQNPVRGTGENLLPQPPARLFTLDILPSLPLGTPPGLAPTAPAGTLGSKEPLDVGP